jgi:hypothetical protein
MEEATKKFSFFLTHKGGITKFKKYQCLFKNTDLKNETINQIKKSLETVPLN